VEPSGRLVYVANWTTSDVTTFAIDAATGALSEVGTEVPASYGARSVAVHPSGRFAYMANLLFDNVTTFAIDPTTGALTEVARRWPPRPCRHP
jgi:6-phosphogluconolactonase (cycloisomerase 2 family)